MKRTPRKPREVNVHQAKTHLSRLLQDVERGEEIIIARAGKPVARLVRFSRVEGERVLGLDRGVVRILEDFDAPLPDAVLRDFEG
jgi:prevent-host-death family protein